MNIDIDYNNVADGSVTIMRSKRPYNMSTQELLTYIARGAA